jgi:hypothetical protein
MLDGVRRDPMMAHLLEALESGEDVGHYGRLVFVMVARHFAREEELVALLTRTPDVSEDDARSLVHQVTEADYNPPKREKILEYQRRQQQPIITNESDPDLGNVYRTLQFPDRVYEHISEYHEAKTKAES